MKIKNKIMTLGLAAISAVAMSSCSDFLDEGPKTSLPEDIIYSDTAYVESNVQTLYKNWRGLFTDRYLWEQMVGTDEIQSGAYQALKEDGGRADRSTSMTPCSPLSCHTWWSSGRTAGPQ